MTRRAILVALASAVAACSSSASEAVTTTTRPTATTVAATSSTVPATTPVASTTTIVLDSLAHSYPIRADVRSSYARSHGGYPATDLFAPCGAEVLAMATGTVTEARVVDRYDRSTDNPALRGGRSVTLVGDDGVRYYMSHFDEVAVTVGARVVAGDPLGTIGLTGDSTSCHTHLGLSPPCQGPEWSVRRGVVWPWPYLDAWRTETTMSPAAEVAAWVSAHPHACADAMADPVASDAA